MNFSPTKRFHPMWLLLAAIIPLYLTWTFDHSLWNPDETRDAGIAAEMYRGGSVAVPKLNGEAFLEKPPLYYWACAVVYKVTGRVTAGTTRLPSVIFGVLGILFTFLIARRLFNPRAGFLAACLLGTSAQYFRMSHVALMDVSLAALVTGAIYFHLRGSKLGFAICTVLAFFAKGFLGVILPGLAVTIDLLLQKKFRQLFKTIAIGAAVFVVLALPWFWALWQEGGRRYLEIFLIDNHWKRFSSSTGDHTGHPWFFYFLSFPGDFLPSTIVFIGFVVSFVRSPRPVLRDPAMKFSLVWFASLFAFFCLSSSKRSIYLLPVFPAAAVLGAAWLDGVLSRCPEERQARGEFAICSLFAGLALLMIGASFFLPARLDREKTFVPYIEEVRARRAGHTLIGFDLSEMELGVIGFYLEGTFKNVKTLGELKEAVGDPSEKVLVMVNRTRKDDVEPLLEKKSRLVFEYRPEKKTRSYLLYAAGKGA